MEPNAPLSGGPSSLSRTAWALTSLGAGFAVGILAHETGVPLLGRFVEGVSVIGRLWVAALQMSVLPLVVSMTFVAIVGAGTRAAIGRLGARTLALFVAMLVAAGLLTLAIAVPAIRLYPVDEMARAAFRAGASTPSPHDAPARPGSGADWLIALVPVNIFEAAARGEILPVLLFTVLVGLAATRLSPERREALHRLFDALAETMMVVVGWILKLLPLGVFALCADFAYRVGIRATGALGFFVILACGILLLATALLYPVTILFGRTSLVRFARAVAPAQIVAVSTRSSLASLPALVEGGRRELGLPETATGFVLPLSVAAFKLSRTITSLIRVLFLAHILGIPMGIGPLASFFAVQLLMSFSTAGIPSVGALQSLPSYVAAGIPLQGVMILNAIDPIPDFFATLSNVTADMSAATILSRRERANAPAGGLAADAVVPRRFRA
jgi:Na+/H+-dicarboxylate symporter